MPGDVCFVWAQFGAARWKNAEGREVADLRAALYDRGAKRATVTENSKSVTVDKGARTVLVPIDEALLKDLVENENNRGLVLFTAQETNGPRPVRERRGGADHAPCR